MNKKIFLATITTFLLLVGCGKVTPTNTPQQNGQSVSTAAATSSAVAKSPDTTTPVVKTTTSDAIDYNQYTKKVWIVKSWTNGPYEYSSFCISKIANGEIEGKFSTNAIIVPDYYYYLPNYLISLGNLTGTFNNGIGECQFSDKDGDKGNVKLVFKTKDELEATIKYTNKAQSIKDLSLDGTLLFRPYNLKDIEGFSPFKDQSFTVDLNSWGNVNFVSGKVIGGKHIPTVAYLTNKDGDILYDFTTSIPNNVGFKAVSFQDVNKDGLKDIIIIGDDSWQIAKVFFQKVDGSFTEDDKIYQEINDSGNNKDVKTVTDYLSKKF